MSLAPSNGPSFPTNGHDYAADQVDAAKHQKAGTSHAHSSRAVLLDRMSDLRRVGVRYFRASWTTARVASRGIKYAAPAPISVGRPVNSRAQPP